MNGFCVIAAFDLSRGVGKNGGMPWDLKSELEWFKRRTQEASEGKRNAVIMGRVTYASLDKSFRPLPKRFNLVLSSTMSHMDGADALFSNLDDALQHCNDREDIESVFVIGGAKVWQSALQHQNCKELLLTHIDHNYDCDRFFPDYESDFVAQKELFSTIENGVAYKIVRYTRKGVG